MPTEDQIVKDAYSFFADWTNGRGKFEALLAEDVVWIEADPDLGPGPYSGRAQVMGHVDTIKAALDQAKFDSVAAQGAFWRAKDTMQVHGHGQHSCITHVTFEGGLITKVRHCLGHDGGGDDGGH